MRTGVAWLYDALIVLCFSCTVSKSVFWGYIWCHSEDARGHGTCFNHIGVSNRAVCHIQCSIDT